LVKRFCSVLYLFFPALFFSCTPTYSKYLPTYHFSDPEKVPDYSKLEYWAAHPYKQSPADSVPEPLKETYYKDSSVDVFFLHPTTFVSKGDTAWNADINDSVINAKTDYTSILYQASAFNKYRLFAPRYRQAHLRAYFTTDSADAHKAFELAYEDIKNSFQYYLDHYNQGRPIIIASHSQGSTHAQHLLKDYFDNKKLAGRLVAAYVIGMVIPKDYFVRLGPCTDSAQTGCIIGWRTYKKGYAPPFVEKENGNSYVVNPLNWSTTNNYGSADLNRGAVLIKFNRVIPRITDAQIHGDILWIHKPHFPGSVFYRSPNYHVGDINLFYVNIRDNVDTRVRAFWKH